MTTDERLLRLQTALKDAGLRSSGPRDRLLRVLVTTDKPVSVQELRRLEGGQMHVATVYRLLDDLLLLGRAVRFTQSKNTFAFALREGRDDSVHYLICERCGWSSAFRECVAGKWLETVPAPGGFRVEYHLSVLHGVCKSCRRIGEGALAESRNLTERAQKNNIANR
ncbi:MAG: transcriptional repressor [Akkermansiaceae bacterium]|nr:transcriptional repressor [Armatimonadota bacterium]